MATYDFDVDFSGIGKLPQIYKQAQLQANRERTLAELGQQGAGPLDYNDIGRKLLSVDPEFGLSLLKLGQQHGFQERQLTEAERSHRAGEAHHAATLSETTRQHDIAPVKIGSDLAGDIYVQRDPNAPGGFRRIDPNTLPTQPTTRPGGPIAGPGTLPPQVNPDGTVAPARATVQPSARVWGDKESGAPYDTAPPQRVAQAQQPAAVAQAPGTPLVGEAFLQAKVPPSMHPILRGLADYTINPSKYGRSTQGLRLIAAAKEFDPSFDETKFAVRSNTATKFGAGQQGNIVRAMDVGIDHLTALDEAGQALKNGNIQAFNAIKNYVKQKFGSEVPVDFNAMKSIVGAEVAKAIVGGQFALEDREQIREALNRANSPEQLSGVIKSFKRLMAGQLSGLQRQWEAGDLPADRFLKKLAPNTLRELGRNPDGTAADFGTSTNKPPPVINSKEEYDKLPSGKNTPFVDKDGKKFFKP